MGRISAIKTGISNSFKESVLDNPVIVRDVRTRMRGKQAFIVMAAYVLFLIIVMTIAYYFTWSSAVSQSASVYQAMINLDMGGILFKTLIWTQTILLALIIPSLTSGAITIEIEKKTIELLALTRLTSEKIILGKQVAGIMYPFILLICSLPLSGICILLGGISPSEVAAAYLALAAWGFLFAAVGIYWSSLFKKTAVAALFSYASIGFYFFFSLSVGMIFAYSYRSGSIDSVFFMLNPGNASMYGILEKTTVYGFQIYGILAAIIIHLLASAILLFSAVSHIKHYNGNRAAIVRLLLISFSVILIWLHLGNQNSFANYSSGVSVSNIPGYMSFLIYMLFFLAAVFCSGSRKPEDRRKHFLYGFSFRKAFTADLAGSMAFMLILSAVSYLAIMLCSEWNVSVYGIAPMIKPVRKLIYSAYISGIFTTLGMSALAILFSSLINKKSMAGIIAAVISLIVLAGYNLFLMVYRAWGVDFKSAIWQLAAFWPLMPLMAISDHIWKNMPDLWWGRGYAWLISSVLYAILMVLFLKLSDKKIMVMVSDDDD